MVVEITDEVVATGGRHPHGREPELGRGPLQFSRIGVGHSGHWSDLDDTPPRLRRVADRVRVDHRVDEYL